MTNLRLLIVGSIAAVASAHVIAGGQTHDWSYSGSGGPPHWAKLDSKFAACAAKS